MKKRIAILSIITIFCATLFMGCGKKEYITTLNLRKTANIIEELTYEKDNKNVPIFYNMTSPNEKEINKIYKIDESMLEELIIRQSALRTKSNLYILAKVKPDKKEVVKKSIDDYMIGYENTWKGQNQTEYNLVVNRSYYENNNYLIYVISYDNNKVIDAFTSSFEEKEVSK